MNDPASLQEEATRAEASAREHKRAEAHHRRRAREEQRRVAYIRAQCERLGIDLKITQAPRRRESQ